MSEWQIAKISDVCTIRYGKDHKHLLDGTIPVYGSGGIMRYADKALYNKKSVLIPRKGTLSNLFFVSEPFWTVDTLFYTEIDEDKMMPEYLYFYMKTLDLSSMNVGTAVPSLTTVALNEIDIKFPDIVEQKAIAAVLSALDDKIELNNRINKTLEEMAQTIFKSWFVDFEPFQDGEFVESELGLIPKGWRVVRLGELVDSIDNRGKTPPLENAPTDYPIIDVKALSGDFRIVDFNNCTKFVSEVTYANFFRSGHPKKLDILISTVGSLAEMKMFYGTIGCVAQNVVAFRANNISPYYLYQYLKHIKNDLISYNIGSVQPSIKVTHIIKHLILMPDAKTLELFDEHIINVSTIIFNNCNQTKTLAALRDTLLPKLMSGEIRIPLEV